MMLVLVNLYYMTSDSPACGNRGEFDDEGRGSNSQVCCEMAQMSIMNLA